MTTKKQLALPENQGSEISNLPKTTSSAEMYYPLEVATKLVQKYYPSIDLLSYANERINDGKISVLVDVPNDVEVITFNSYENWMLPRFTCVPEKFVLRGIECIRVERNGKDWQCDFKRGYTFSSGQSKETHPYDNAHPGELKYAKTNWVWRTIYTDNRQACNVKLTRDCLFVLHSEVAKQFPLIEIGDQPEERHKDSQHQDVAALKSENKTEEPSTKLGATTTTTPTPAAKVDADKNEPETKKSKSNGEPCVIEDPEPEDNHHEQEQAIGNQETILGSKCTPAKPKRKGKSVDKKNADDKPLQNASSSDIHPLFRDFDILPDSGFVPIEVVCSLFHCSESTVVRDTKSGKLKKHKRGRSALWKVGELREALRKIESQSK